MSANSDRIIEVFCRAKAKAPGVERDRYLAEACHGDEALRDQVVSLLRADVAVAGDDFLKNTRIGHAREDSLRSGTKVEYFGDYVLLKQIGEGGMGTVYLARQISLNRTVALKMIRSGQLATAAEVQRFHIEAEAVANLAHPNIVPIYEIGEHEGRRYFSMEFVEGVDMEEKLEDRRWSTEERVRLIATVARAVNHAHQRGIIHRDLKPSNILVDLEGRPRVTDFGLARRLEGNGNLTQPGVPMGTPNYMAPEQVLGRAKQMTTGIDVWSLGVILYHLLTNCLPFKAETLEATFRRILDDEPQRPRSINPEIHEDLETICLACLEKNLRQRLGSAELFVRQLELWLEGKPIELRPYSIWERFVKWVKRKPAIAALAGSVLLVFTLGAVGTVWQWQRAEQKAKDADDQRSQAEQARERAEKESIRFQLQTAEHAFDLSDAPRALAILARLVRNNPSNRVVAERLLNALDRRSFSVTNNALWQELGSTRITRMLAPSRMTNTPGPPPRVDQQIAEDELYEFWTRPYNRVAPGSGSDNAGSAITPATASPPSLYTFDLSPDGRLAVIGLDRSARVWDRASRVQVAELLHDATVTCTRFSPDSQRVATGTSGRFRVWDARTGIPLTDWFPSEQRVAEIWFATDGSAVLTASGGWSWLANKKMYEEMPLKTEAAVMVHRLQGAAPDWLPKLAEALGGTRFGEWGLEYPAGGLIELKAELDRSADNSALSVWVKQFLARTVGK